MRKPQKRSIETRTRILDVARKHVLAQGYDALRTEEVVAEAGVAKGTLFAHFGDKDQLLLVLMGEELSETIALLSELSNQTEITPEDFASALIPLLNFLSREQVIFNLFQFYVGVSSENVNGEIEEDCNELEALVTDIVKILQNNRHVRIDIAPSILGEGCLAFLVQAVTFRLCGFYKNTEIAEIEFRQKLQIWLNTPKLMGDR